MIEFDSVEIPTPGSYTVSVNDISKAERNANGTIIIERIATKRKIELSWPYLSSADLSTLFSNFSSNTFISVTYPDPVTGAARTGTFYAGDRSAGAIDYQAGVIRWKDVKFNLIEQ